MTKDNRGFEAAKLCSKSTLVIVGRVNGILCVSDNRFITVLRDSEYMEFVKKFASYKDNPLPPLDITDGVCYKYTGKGQPFKEVEIDLQRMLDCKSLQTPDNVITDTGFMIANNNGTIGHIYKAKVPGIYRTYDARYMQYIQACNTLYTDTGEKDASPVYGVDSDGNSMLVVAPVLIRNLREQIEDLAG